MVVSHLQPVNRLSLRFKWFQQFWRLQTSLFLPQPCTLKKRYLSGMSVYESKTRKYDTFFPNICKIAQSLEFAVFKCIYLSSNFQVFFQIVNSKWIMSIWHRKGLDPNSLYCFFHDLHCCLVSDLFWSCNHVQLLTYPVLDIRFCYI